MPRVFLRLFRKKTSDFRQSHKGIQKIISLFCYLFPTRAKELDTKHILVGNSKYVRVDDFIYENMTSGTMLGITIGEDGFVRLTEMIDYVKLPTGLVIVSWLQVIVVISMLIFAIITFIRYIVLCMKRKSASTDHLQMLTLLITALLIGNVFVTALRLIDMQPLKAVKGFMHFSRLLGMIIAALDFGNIISIVKTKGKSKWSIGFCVNHILFMVTLLNLGIFAE